MRTEKEHISSNKKTSERQWPREDRRLALDLLQADPLFYRIPSSDVLNLVKVALTHGAEKAESILERSQTSDPLKLARAFDVRVIFDITLPMKQKTGDTRLSCFTPNPPSIIVYENTIRIVREKLLEKTKLSRDFLSRLTNMCVCHEMYHFFEHSGFDFINLAYKIPIIDLKMFKIEKSLSMPAEIAANSFTKRFMDLPMLPCVVHDRIRDVEGTFTGGTIGE